MSEACSGGEDIVRLVLDGTVIKTRIDKKATNISVLAAIGVRRDGQKVLLSIMNMGGESTAAWRKFLDDLDARGIVGDRRRDRRTRKTGEAGYSERSFS